MSGPQPPAGYRAGAREAMEEAGGGWSPASWLKSWGPAWRAGWLDRQYAQYAYQCAPTRDLDDLAQVLDEHDQVVVERVAGLGVETAEAFWAEHRDALRELSREDVVRLTVEAVVAGLHGRALIHVGLGHEEEQPPGWRAHIPPKLWPIVGQSHGAGPAGPALGSQT